MNPSNDSSTVLQTLLNAFSHTIEEYRKGLNLVFNRLNDPKVINALLNGIKTYVDTFSEGTKKALFVLAKNGWFISLEMPPSVILNCATFALEGEIDKADNIMAAYFSDHASEINNSLSLNFVNRATIIDSAFKAHHLGDYNLSIPVFLIQTDGICNELIGIEMFGRRNSKPKTATYVDQFEKDSFLSALLEPFRVCLPLTASEKERELFTIENYLNRHEILHGTSVNYGTKLNSLKAISLINFVSTVLKKIKP